jgi:hypothetical protein
VGAGVAGGVGACAESKYGAVKSATVQNGTVQNTRASGEGRQVSFMARRTIQVPIVTIIASVGASVGLLAEVSR